MLRFFSLFFVLLFGLCSPASAQVYHKIQGTALWLAPPEGYEISRNFTGFMNEKTGGSILVIALPAAAIEQTYSQFQNQDAFSALMKAQGFDITSHTESKTKDGLDLKVYTGTQKNQSLLYYRWVTMLVAQKNAYVISMQSPQNGDLNEESVMKTFRTARIFGAPEREEELATLPFTIKAVAPFAVETIVMGNTMQLIVPGEKKAPLIFISMNLDRLTPGDAEGAEKLYLSSIAGSFKVKAGAEEKTVPFAGTTGRLLEGVATTKTGDQDFLLYTGVDDKGHAFYLNATAEKGMLARYRNAIDEIAMSLVPRTTP